MCSELLVWQVPIDSGFSFYRQNSWKNRVCYVFGTDDDNSGLVVLPLLLWFSGTLVKCHKFVVCTKPRSKLKHSKTAAPIELRRVTMLFTTVHLFNCGSNFSTEFSDELPSFPPSAYKFLSISTTSCVDLQKKKNKKMVQLKLPVNFGCASHSMSIFICHTVLNASLWWAPTHCVAHWIVHL